MASARMKEFKNKINKNKDKCPEVKHRGERTLIIKSNKREFHVDIYSSGYINQNELRFVLDDLTEHGMKIDTEVDLSEFSDVFMKVTYLGSKMLNGAMVERYIVKC